MKEKSMYFQRGQIWWLERDANEMTPHVMESKDRYYLVLSCTENNQSAPIANVCVISSKKYDGYPMHVPFTMPSGKYSIIECEHIYTKSITKFKKGQYAGVVPDHIMDRVNVALARQLSIQQYIPGYEAIEDMIVKIAQLKKEQMFSPREVTDDTVLSICKRISDIFEIEPYSESQQVIEEPQVVEEVKVTEDVKIIEEVKTIDEVSEGKVKQVKPKKRKSKKSKTKKIVNTRAGKPKRTYNRWTEERVIQFLYDCDAMTLEEVANKYNLSNAESAYKTKCRLLKVK